MRRRQWRFATNFHAIKISFSTHTILLLSNSGPMVIQREDKRFQLAGIISWGKMCLRVGTNFRMKLMNHSVILRYRMCGAKSAWSLHQNIRVP